MIFSDDAVMGMALPLSVDLSLLDNGLLTYEIVGGYGGLTLMFISNALFNISRLFQCIILIP